MVPSVRLPTKKLVPGPSVMPSGKTLSPGMARLRTVGPYPLAAGGAAQYGHRPGRNGYRQRPNRQLIRCDGPPGLRRVQDLGGRREQRGGPAEGEGMSRVTLPIQDVT